MTEKLRWGIIGTGHIAEVFASQLPHSRTGEVVAVGSRTQHAADAFGQRQNIARCHGSYDALLADDDVQAVYISTPHPMHAEWAIKAARAGKHILCEKPMTMNHAEAVAVVDAARENDVFLMEAFMYRCHPQTAKVLELIREGKIGDVRVIQVAFSFHADYNIDSRLLSKTLGGGGILDVGCYCASMARLIAGAATGKEFADPIEVKGVGHLGKTGVDEYTVAVLKFPGEIVATLTTGVQVAHDNALRIYGSAGSISVPWPWCPAREGGESTVLFRQADQDEQAITVTADAPIYAIEADRVADHLESRQAPSPAMTWDDTLGNMKTLDRWRKEIGLTYDADRQ